jgi:hypothetical protein
MARGAGLVTTTNARSSLRSVLATSSARFLKPPKRSLNSLTNSATCSRKPEPVNLLMPASTTLAPRVRSETEKPLPPSTVDVSQRMAGESMRPATFSGASRKSSALAVGGVSRMTRS